MGSTSVGVMFGVKPTARERRLAEEFARDHGPFGEDERLAILGFWVAVQNGGDRLVPDIEAPIALDEIATAKPTAKAYARAKARWEAFATWCAAQGKPVLGARLWIAAVEVA